MVSLEELSERFAPKARQRRTGQVDTPRVERDDIHPAWRKQVSVLVFKLNRGSKLRPARTIHKDRDVLPLTRNFLGPRATWSALKEAVSTDGWYGSEDEDLTGFKNNVPILSLGLTVAGYLRNARVTVSFRCELR